MDALHGEIRSVLCTDRPDQNVVHRNTRPALCTGTLHRSDAHVKTEVLCVETLVQHCAQKD
jgi:hypothetical protein